MARGHKLQNHGMAPPADSRDALQWFVNNYGLYMGSPRGLFLSDWTEEQSVSLEAAVINLKSRGFSPFTIAGETLLAQADYLYQEAQQNNHFGRPLASKVELELSGNDIVIVDGLEAPEKPHHLWYLWSYLLFPRAIAGKVTILTTPLSYQEFVRYGNACPDFDYQGKPINWEKLIWLIESCTINQELFKLAREESVPPMLKSEYYFYAALRERGLDVVPQHVLGDYLLDFALIKGEQRLNIECDILSPLSGHEINTRDAKRDFVLLSDGWQILKFSSSELLNNRSACSDVVEDIWKGGRKRSHCGRFLSGKSLPQTPELPNDDAQRNAIVFGGGPLALVGGAGTGKTVCIAQRCAYLLSQGISPESILILSMTADSAKLLKQTIAPLIEKPLLQRLNVLCWNDLGMRILKENLPAIKRKPPLKLESSPQKVLQKLLSKAKKEVDAVKLEIAGDLDEFYLAATIGMYKAHLISPKQAKDDAQGDAEQIIAKIYQNYEDQLQKANRIDKHDLAFLTVQILLDHEESRTKYQSAYEFVLVDEYQDLTVAQEMLARMLAAPQDNLFIAGDEDETISESNNACPELLSDFTLRFPNGRCITLEHNWRSHPLIVEHARLILAHLERSKIRKDFISAWGQAPSEAVFGPQICADDQEEAKWIAAQVKALLTAGRNPGEIAVLYRQNHFEAMIEEELAAVGVKFHASHSDNSLIPDEVGDMIAFLKLVMDPDGPKARESFERVCQLGTKEIDPKLSATISSFAGANNLSYLKAVEIYAEATADQSCRELEQLVRIIRAMNQDRLPPAESIGYLRRTRRLNDYYKSIKIPPGQIYEPLKKLGALEEEARKFTSVSEFIKHAEERQGEEEENPEEQTVHVKSINDVKGFECAIVFLSGLAQGLFPQEGAEDLEEERRLFYVAFTRAKEAIFLSLPAQFAGKERLPSIFLSETRLIAPQVYEAAQQAAAYSAAMAAAPAQQSQVYVEPTGETYAPAAYAAQESYAAPAQGYPQGMHAQPVEQAYAPLQDQGQYLPQQDYTPQQQNPAQNTQLHQQLPQAAPSSSAPSTPARRELYPVDVDAAYGVEETRGALAPFVDDPEPAPVRGMDYVPPPKGSNTANQAPAESVAPVVEPQAAAPIDMSKLQEKISSGPPGVGSAPRPPQPPPSVAPAQPLAPKPPVAPVPPNLRAPTPPAAPIAPTPPTPPSSANPPIPPTAPASPVARGDSAQPSPTAQRSQAASQSPGGNPSQSPAPLQASLPQQSPAPLQGAPPLQGSASQQGAVPLQGSNQQEGTAPLQGSAPHQGAYRQPNPNRQHAPAQAQGPGQGYASSNLTPAPNFPAQVPPAMDSGYHPSQQGMGSQANFPSGGPSACPSCAMPLEENARFCGECGYSIPAPGAAMPTQDYAAAAQSVVVCNICATVAEPGAKFCGECGTPYSQQGPEDLQDAPSGKPGEKSWMVKFLKFLED